MEFENSIEVTKLLLLLFLVLICSVTDLSVRRIPNAILLPALMAAIYLNSLAGGLAGLIDSIAGLALGVLMLLPLHVLGRMGAGDVKLLGVVGSILGAWGAIVAGLATMMAGGILGIAYILWLFAKPAFIAQVSRIKGFMTGEAGQQPDPMQFASVRAAEIPYAIAIAAGTFATLIYLDLLLEVNIT